jgi:hypothetical protein
MRVGDFLNLLPPIVVRLSRVFGIKGPWSVRNAITLREIFESDSESKSLIPTKNKTSITLENVIIDLKSGNCFDENYSVIQESSNWPVSDLTKGTIPRPIASPHTYSFDKVGVALPSNGFYHWLIEDLPNVVDMLEQKSHRKVFIYQNAPRYILDFLTIFEMDFQKFPRFSKFSKLTMPIRQQNVGQPNLDDVSTLRNLFFPKLTRFNNLENVYISRVKSSRSPKFERELQSQLIGKGWRIAYLEEMDLITQFNVFHNAKTIMGIHGAGLSGLVFADIKTPVIEIYPVDRNIRCFESLVSATGHTLIRIPFEKGARRVPLGLMSMINSL